MLADAADEEDADALGGVDAGEDALAALLGVELVPEDPPHAAVLDSAMIGTASKASRAERGYLDILMHAACKAADETAMRAARWTAMAPVGTATGSAQPPDRGPWSLRIG